MWVVGPRGIKLQDNNGKVSARAPGEPVPEAGDFRKRELLISLGMIKWVNDGSKKATKEFNGFSRTQKNAIKEVARKNKKGKKQLAKFNEISKKGKKQKRKRTKKASFKNVMDSRS